MKSITSITAGVVTASALLLGSIAVKDASTSNTNLETLQACVWITYCGQPEIFKPITEPKDSKTETQDTKDEKVA